ILLLVLIGSVFGLLLAVAFGQGMLALMARLWPDASAGSFLHFHAAGVSLAIGFFATLLIGSLTIVWGLFFLFRVSPSALLAGLTTPTRDFIASQNPLPLPPLRGERAGVRGVSNSQLSGSTPSPPSPLPRSGGEGSTRRAIESSERRWHLKPILIAFGLIFGLASLAAGVFLRNPMFQALTFFTGGALLLTSFLLLLHTWLKRDRTSHPFGHGLSALFQLGTRNAQRHPTRSLLTAGLLASAAFLLVAVESFRREPARDFLKKSGGSGGMPVFIQTDLPVYKDLNTDGREDVLDAVRIHYQRQKDSESVEQRAEEARKTLEQVTIYSCRVKPGDDVSCLNLYQATRPQMLGVPESLIHRGGFKFLSSEAENSKEKNNPWLLLDHTQEDRAIPVIGEENTITWMLKKDLGEEIEITDDSGNPVRLRIVAILKDSVFQSGLLLSSRNFQRLFPRQEGFTLHLIEGSPEQANAAAELLRVGLAKQGPEVVQSRERVATFMAVENTYLTTFQLLGGLGLLLGSLGLAVVLLRNVWERRGELALLRALGYRHSDLGELILAENSLLLLAGLAIGTTAAILSVLPHLIQEGALPSPRPLLMLAAVLVAGLLAGSFAMISALRAPLIPALRKE
ncbi:MAG TPA: FtsX-like permease family protein, partial [Gemmataceae bacterium]|nr:FtsX-like permease family protein [Gemmataceae bacterium]